MDGVRIWGVPVRIHPALPFALAAALVLGADARLGIALVSLMAHELSHVAMALALKVRVSEIELMPMGGAARVEGVWRLRGAQVALIALAGPLANLVICLGSAALGYAGLLSGYAVYLWLGANATMMVFNLLPALPLDGGRLLCALLAGPLGQQRALRAGVWLGRFTAVALIALCLAGYMALGAVNLTLLMSGAFLWISSGRELALNTGAVLISLIDRQSELANEGVLPLRWMAAAWDAPVSEVLSSLTPRQVHRIAVYDAHMNFSGTVEEEALIRASSAGAQQKMSELLAIDARAGEPKR